MVILRNKEDWRVYPEELARRSRDSVRVVRTCLEELERVGYVRTYRKSLGRGKGIQYYSGTDFSLIVSKEAFMKRAERCEGYDGFEAGITVMRNGEMVEIEGSLKLPDDVLIGGWAIVYRKDRSHRYKVTVDFNEYVKLDKYGNPRSTWKSMPGTMIRKTALVQTLREAFPDELGNMYTDIDGGDTFDAIKDVTPQETQEEVRARKMAQIEQYKQEQTQKQTQKADTSYPVDEVSEHTDDPVQGELLDGELEY